MPFIDLSTVTPQQIFPGVQIRAPYGENLMLSVVDFEAESEVTLHSHPHEQAGVMLEGHMELTIGDETRVLNPGEFYIIPPNTPHRAAGCRRTSEGLGRLQPHPRGLCEALANRSMNPP